MKRKPKNETEALLALTLVNQLGAQRIRLLRQGVDRAAAIFAMSKSELQRIKGIGPNLASTIFDFDQWQQVDAHLKKTQKTNAQLVHYYEDCYPTILREIYDPPILLWVKGDPGVLGAPCVAVIGTRRATSYGKKMAVDFSSQLVSKGLAVVSGLAYGIDAAAHKATLKAGGKTIAVLGSGIDNIYPRNHKKLARVIQESGGAIISEFPPGTPPDAGNFPVRNRIVSGLSLGTLVVESPLKGGSMITAQSALTQNREVFVVPHNLSNANGIGCNHLIKRAAGKLVQSIEDVLDELPHSVQEGSSSEANKKPEAPRWKKLELDEEAQAVCALLDGQAMHIDDISEALDKTSSTLLPILLQLEMQQCVRQTAGKNFELL